MSERILPLPAYVASLAPRDLADARRLVALVPKRATAIEARLDLCRERIATAPLLDLDPRPLVVTYRTRAEGGDFSGSPEEYRRLVREAYEAGGTVDVEHASGLLADSGQLPDRRRVIVSHHSPFSIPPDWNERLSAMLATRARAVKLVCGTADLAASLTVASIQARHRRDSVAFLPMGPASPPGRVLAALSGAALVYGPVETPTASGQVSLRELLTTYEVDRPRQVDALFGIIGAEVSGSLSPAVHNALFRSRGLPFLYLPLPVADWERTDPLRLAFDPPFRGFSVTRPWKLVAARSAPGSEDVVATKAANTLLRRAGRWRAENTDVDGVFDPLADHDTGEGRTAVVLGTGGVARAAVVAARRLGYEVLIAGRNNEAADVLGAELGVDSLALEDLEASEADLYLNATPIGSHPDDPAAFPARILENRPLIFDCVYRRDGGATLTIAAARAAGCPTVEGIQMFAAQAVRQACLFGVEDAALEEVERLLREAS
ncbi:MAG TPA: type I 3-dehydroquinate dehydratase [Thermoanaerobaculia bacterium]|nr:type I 3-dehydroquinate dehydratase [Thermoanaerobaculia bacterium]